MPPLHRRPQRNHHDCALKFLLFSFTLYLVFLENNNKTQTISLVRKRFNLFWFLAIRVKRARFLQLLSCSLTKNVGRKRVQRTRFLSKEVSSLKNRVHWTRFLCIKHCQFPSFCLITPIPQQHQLPTAATSRGHNSPPTATSRGSQLDWFVAVGSHNFRNSALTPLWNSLSSLTYHSTLTSTNIFTNSLSSYLYETSFLNSLALTEHSSHSGNIFTILWLFARFFF